WSGAHAGTMSISAPASCDPTLSWSQVDCFDGSLHGARAGSVQGFLERLRKAHQRMRTAGPLPGNGKGPPGGPQNFWVPFAAIETLSRRTKSLSGTPLPVTHPWLVEMPYSRHDCFWRGRTCYYPFVCAMGPIPTSCTCYRRTLARSGA